jgi:hypothetical protein
LDEKVRERDVDIHNGPLKVVTLACVDLGLFIVDP